MKERILLIEDEIELQQNLMEILEYHGFSVFTADNGIDAIFKIKDQEVDLVLCDIMMPEMDGFQFLRIFRNEERHQNTPFIFLSAKVSAEDKAKGLQEGADDYLTKPISARLLLNAIYAAFDKKRECAPLPSFINQNGSGADHATLLSATTTPVSGLINVLENLKSVTDSTDRKEISQLVCLALTSAQWIHSSFVKLPLFKNLEKSPGCPTSVNLNDLILDAMDKLGAERFSYATNPVQNLIFDAEQIKFIIRELLENSLNFNSDASLVQVKCFGNELSIQNKQSVLGQIKELQIEAFAQSTGDSTERKGLGLGLFLCREYCRINEAKLQCSIDAEGNFTAQIFFLIS